MASLFEGLDTPKFIGPFEQMQMANAEAQAVGRNFIAGMEMAQQSKAQKQQLALRLQQFALESRQQQDTADDAAEINRGRDALSRGEDFVPKLKTIHGQNTWNMLSGQNTVQSAKQTLWKEYLDAIKFEAKAVSAFDGLKPFSREWTDMLGTIQGQQRERKRVEELAAFEAKQKIQQAGRTELAQIRADAQVQTRQMMNESSEFRAIVRQGIADSQLQTREADKRAVFIKDMVTSLQGFKGNSKKTPSELMAQAEALWEDHVAGAYSNSAVGSAAPIAPAPQQNRVLEWNPETNDFR